MTPNAIKIIMREHVSELVAENFLRVVWVETEDDCDVWEDVDNRFVSLVKPIDRGGYICDLHQIGHHLSDGSSNLYKDEVYAWMWAFDNSRLQITELAFNTVRDAIKILVPDVETARGFTDKLHTYAMTSNEMDRP